MYNSLVNNPFYNWNDKKPILCTYYNINKDFSSLDPGSKIQYDNINDESPIRYNRIYDFVLYGFNRIELNTENGDFGLEASEISGDAYILPNTIIPTEGDYFEVRHIKDSTWLFIITDVQQDTLQNGSNAYKITYRLEYDDNDQIQNKIKHNYRMIDVREGTNIVKIVDCLDYEIAKIMDEKAVALKKYYQELFYNDKVQTFIFTDLTEFRMYDPFMIEFLIRNKILDNGEDDYIHVDHKLFIRKTFSLDYDRTFFRCFEKCDKDKLLASDHRITYRLIKSFGTTFASRYEAYYEVLYEDTPAQGYNMTCIADDLIFRIKENNLITIKDEQYLYDYFLWENVIIKYFNNEPYTEDEVNSIDNIIYKFKDIMELALNNKEKFFDVDSALKVFYIMPLLIFCLERGIEKVLK
jgi:hypothetical protein